MPDSLQEKVQALTKMSEQDAEAEWKRLEEEQKPKSFQITPNAKLIQGDCLQVMKEMPDCSVDSVVCDPPAGIAFMQAEWDSNKGGMEKWVDWLAECMKEALRVSKPGGHALVWALPRTSHWTGLALERAGWEVRDCVVHCFGSGFPKSHNVALSIDKSKGGKDRGKAMATSSTHLPNGKYATEKLPSGQALPAYEGENEESQAWSGFGTALKPAAEFWYVARKPFEGNVAANVLKHGTGALNIDACRIGTGSDKIEGDCAGTNALHDGGITTRAKVDQSVGRWPANLALSHSDNCKIIGQEQVKGRAINKFTDGAKPFGNGAGHPYSSEQFPDEQVDVFECVPDCPVRILDEQSGDTGNKWKTNYGEKYADEARQYSGGTFAGGGYLGASTYADSGGASRYFATFSDEREDQCLRRTLGDTSEKQMVDGIASGENQESEKSFRKLSQDGFGKGNTEKSPADSRFITETRIPQTTNCQTLNSSTPPPTTISTSENERTIASETELKRGAVSDVKNITPSPSSIHEPLERTPDTASPVHESPLGSGERRIASTTTPICEPTKQNDVTRFFYCAKPSRAERNAGLDEFPERNERDVYADGLQGPRPHTSDDYEWERKGARNSHPTVKPIELMRWLVRLVTPPKATVLDPFTGSGSTGCAAVLEGFNFIGIEREPEYVKIAEARIRWWSEHPEGITLNERLKSEAEHREKKEAGQDSLFV